MTSNKKLIALALAAAAVAFTPVCRADGLDSIKDDRLLNELSSRGMDELLDRAFDENKTPPEQRDNIKTVASLARLTSDEKMSDPERQEAIKKVAAAIDRLLVPIENDPPKLLALAQTLASNGVDREVAILEFWGESDLEKAKLRPIADAAVKIYGQAAQAANDQANKIANNIANPNDPAAAQWQKMVDLSAGATYQKMRLSYAQALSMEKSDPARAKIIDDALNPDTGFPQWDNTDSGIQSSVRLMMTKFDILKGDYAAAATLADSLVQGNVTNPPTPDGMKFEAHCYKIIAAIAGDKPADADKEIESLRTDPSALVPQNAAVLKLLNYRVLALKADKLPDGPAKDAANNAAIAELQHLVTEFPDLKKLIFDQLIARLPANPDYSKSSPVLLVALLEDARQEVILESTTKKNQDAADKAKLQRGLGAAREIVARGPEKFDPGAVIDSALLIGFFQQYLGDKLAAANSMLDYVEKYALDTNPRAKASFALDSAQELIGGLRKSSPVDSDGNPDPAVERIQLRFMKVALAPPFNRKEFALQYATQLSRMKQWMDAVKYYKMVPDNSEIPMDLLKARYGEMFCLSNELDTNDKLTPSQRTPITTQILELAGTINTIGGKILKTSSSDGEKVRARSILASTALSAANIAWYVQKDPHHTLDVLKGFEDSVQGLPAAKDLLKDALQLRVQAFMQLKQDNDATASLVEYLKSANSNEGASTVQTLLIRLNNELDKSRADADAAREKKDTAAADAADKEVAQIARNRAVLSNFLVDYTSKSDDPKIKANTYTYRRFAADTHRLSASLETDADKRVGELKDALKEYQGLLTPENKELYKNSIDPASHIDKNQDDPLVTLGIGLIDYELGDWKGVKTTIGPLVAADQLGSDNDQYWEATYKLLDAMHKLAKSGDTSVTDAEVQQSLKLLYVNWRDETGGKKYKDKFESLRQELMPDWKLAASTQPAA